MFARRDKVPFHKNIRRILWPQRGWKRAGLFYWYKFARAHGTSHAVATGFAIGFCVSFTPLVGLHVAITFVLCWLVRANYAAGLIGTLIFNPVTALPILAFVYSVGLALFHFLGVSGAETLPSIMSFSDLYHTITTHFLKVYLPWFVGGLLMAICLYPFAYMLGMFLVRLRDKLKAQRLISFKNMDIK